MKKISDILISLSFFLFISCDGCSKEPLIDVLEQPCYLKWQQPQEFEEISSDSAEYKERNVGACKTGIITKDEQQNKICTGEIESTVEQCNGIDDNCDGQIDNSYLMTRNFSNPLNECNVDKPGVCRFTSQVCSDGQWVCVPPENFGEEICDGRDNDCDGLIDEDTLEEPIFDGTDRFIYSADPNTINVGECRAGYKECVDGKLSIRNMRTPVPEICGNSDDDDCDGLTDESSTGSSETDYVLIIDYSGSMSDVNEAVADALCSWASQGILINSRFAVIAIGYIESQADTFSDIIQTKLLTDFTNSQTACEIIRVNNDPTHSANIELQLDATYGASDSNSSLFVSWQLQNKKVFIFSDEQLQQNLSNSIQEALSLIIQQCFLEDYIIGAFIDYNVNNQTQWVELTRRCNGFLDYLSQDPITMINTLNYWVGEDCQEN